MYLSSQVSFIYDITGFYNSPIITPVEYKKTTLSTLKSHFGPDEIKKKKKLDIRKAKESERPKE